MNRRDHVTSGVPALAARVVAVPASTAEHHAQGAPRAPEIETELAGQIQDLVAADNRPAARDLFSQIVTRQQRRASRIAWHYLRDSADADEAVQDAFVKAYTHIASFQRTLSFEVWFTRILINGCLDRQKARVRRSRWLTPVAD